MTKCSFWQTFLWYLGHQVTAHGIGPDPSKLQAIAELQAPDDADALRRALGMFTFLAKFLPALATFAAPLRDLLRKDTPWLWTDTHCHAFAELKRLAADAPCLSYYEPVAPTVKSADASSYGLGGYFALTHHHWMVPSRLSTEKRYAQIEKELPATVWGCEHFRQYLHGAPRFTVHTDHKPLIPLINTRDLDRVPICCQRLLIRRLHYNAHVEYIPGKEMVLADTLSRALLLSFTDTDTDVHKESEPTIACVTSAFTNANRRQTLITSRTADKTLQSTIHYTLHGWPASVPDNLKLYLAEHSLLSFRNSLLSHGFGIVIPAAEQPAFLEATHRGHQGATEYKAQAKSAVWCPEVSKAIDSYVQSCATCTKFRLQLPEPLTPSAFPSLPWEKIAMDLCHHNGLDYLVVVDYFSRFLHAIQV